MNHIKLSKLPKKQWQKIRHKHANKYPFDLKVRTDNLRDIKKILDGLKLRFYLTNGTALAAYREHDWIPWDDDVDLDVYMEDLLPAINDIQRSALGNGFICRVTRGGKSGKISFLKNGEKVAIRGLYLDKSYKSNKYRLRKRYKYPRVFYENSRQITFKGMKFNIPDPKPFMVYVYGPRWRTPMKSDNEKEYSTSKIRR